MTQDQADRLQDGTLPVDPMAETEPVGKPVPRVLSVRDILEASTVRAMSMGTEQTWTTGHYKLDRITGGFRPGFTWVLGADTSWGKSSWGIAVADENIKRGRRVLLVSSEDTEEVYGDRLMVRRARVDAIRYRDRRMKPEERDRVSAVARAAEDVPVFVDARKWSVEDLAPHLANIIRREAIDIIVFDYVQEFQSRKSFREERLKYKHISSVCRHIAKDAKIAGIIMSQLTIEDKSKVPTRHNIRECRDIAHAAEVIILGFEPSTRLERDNGTTIEAGSKCLIVDKVKNGPKNAKLVLEWDAKSACFDNTNDPDAERIEGVAQNWQDVGQDYTPADFADYD